MFFNYFDHRHINTLLKTNFTSQNPIFLQNTDSEFIIFENNSFDSNIGLYGGAILIDNKNNPNISENVPTPFIVLKNNSFTKNMAYLEGNAVHIVGGQTADSGLGTLQQQIRGLMHIKVENCKF